jgi:hypothetical protein
VDLEGLLAREGIRDLVARYNSYGDTGRFEPLFALFAEDAVMEIGDASGEPTVYEGRENVERIFAGAQDRIRAQASTSGPTYIRHFTATHQIDLVDADHASGRSYFAVIMDAGIDHWGRYIDRYVRIDGEWRFEHRRVYIDGRTNASWFSG